jgi:hypothetical protein
MSSSLAAGHYNCARPYAEREMELQKLYRHRFDSSELAAKARIWQTLCDHFFAKFVRPSDTIVDVGAGYCEFINHIHGARKIAIDLNPQGSFFVKLYLAIPLAWRFLGRQSFIVASKHD